MMLWGVGSRSLASRVVVSKMGEGFGIRLMGWDDPGID